MEEIDELLNLLEGSNEFVSNGLVAAVRSIAGSCRKTRTKIEVFEKTSKLLASDPKDEKKVLFLAGIMADLVLSVEDEEAQRAMIDGVIAPFKDADEISRRSIMAFTERVAKYAKALSIRKEAMDKLDGFSGGDRKLVVGSMLKLWEEILPLLDDDAYKNDILSRLFGLFGKDTGYLMQNYSVGGRL